jgi:hypothetical protein
VRNIRVSVVQIGDGNQPVVDPEVRNSIQERDLPGTHEGRKIVQSTSDNQETQVSDRNELGLLAGEQGAQRVEVAVSESVGTGRGSLVGETLVAGADVKQQVELPSKDLVSQKGDSVVERCLLDKLDELAHEAGLSALNLRLSWRNKDGVLLDVTMVTVVSSMGNLPRVERHHKKGVNSPSNKVVQPRGLGEGAMATFVTNDPHSGTNTALNKAIENPCTIPEKWRRQIINLES